MNNFSYTDGGAVLYSIPPVDGRHFHIFRWGMDDSVWNVMLAEMKINSSGVYTPDVDKALYLFDVYPDKYNDMRDKVTQELMDKCTDWIKSQIEDTQSGSKFPSDKKAREQLDWIFKNAVSFDPKTLKLNVNY